MNSFFSITTFSMYINNCFIHNSYPPQIPISQFQKLEFEQKPKGLMSPMLFSFLLLFQFKHSQFVRFFFLTAPHFTLLFILFLL